MASTEEEASTLDASTAVPRGHEPTEEAAELGNPKRKAEAAAAGNSPKRAKYRDHDDDADRHRRRSATPPRRDSRGEYPSANHDRKRLATQEEKKRGRRLFGGVLNTLSQRSTNPQQQRRQEIERRQQERLQKQKEEDEQRRAEKAARMHDIRMSQQIVFEEEVMRNRHAKLLSMAKYLRTKARPHICYLPWKPTPEQGIEIENQIRDTKATIEKEVESFKVRKARHIRDHSRSRPSPSPVAKPTTDQGATEPQDQVSNRDTAEAEKPLAKRRDQSANQHRGHHHHDESADVVEEADEDMVIY